MSRNKTPCFSNVCGVYAVTDASVSTSSILIQQVESAILGGIRVLQYRAKNLSGKSAFKNAHDLALLCARYDVMFIINDDVELALAVKADGVHVGRDDGDLEYIRAALKQGILGVSCYNDLSRAQDMQARGASYVAFGRFFPSLTKPDAGQADISTLQKAKNSLSIPVVAIGGITPANAPALINAGADAIAVVNGIFGQSDIENAASEYARLFS